MPTIFTFIFSQTSTSAGGERGCTKLTTIRAVMTKMPEENFPQAIQQWHPEIIALFCRHGICYDFQVMESHEPPWHTFEIFLFRFPVPTQMIIYDNGCKLHQYVLNHEPVHFKNTIFLVDRFHWQDTWDVPAATPSIVIHHLMLLHKLTSQRTRECMQGCKGSKATSHIWNQTTLSCKTLSWIG